MRSQSSTWASSISATILGASSPFDSKRCVIQPRSLRVVQSMGWVVVSGVLLGPRAGRFGQSVRPVNSLGRMEAAG